MFNAGLARAAAGLDPGPIDDLRELKDPRDMETPLHSMYSGGLLAALTEEDLQGTLGGATEEERRNMMEQVSWRTLSGSARGFPSYVGLFAASAGLARAAPGLLQLGVCLLFEVLGPCTAPAAVTG